MSAARDVFLAHMSASDDDDRFADVSEARRSLTKAKLEALDQVGGLDEGGMRLVIPGLYQQIVATTIKVATRVGVAVGLALEAVDETHSQVAIGSFSRPVREQMTEIGVAMKRQHASKIARQVGELAAQRLAWRHNHEFLSWLGFRRDDPRYPPADRRARLEAFKVQERMLKSRAVVTQMAGSPLAIALEGHDRFMLANRWRLDPHVPEHSVESFVWPLLSMQPAEVVQIELARAHHDLLVGARADDETLSLHRRELLKMLIQQLANALDHVPPGLA